ncbi:MAG: hypothetical protein ACREP6_13700 [Candidatus Binataceae bacterium]
MRAWWESTALIAAFLAAILIAGFGVSGCSDDLAQENSNQLQQQQRQIEDLQQQLDALKTQQRKFYTISSQIAPGGCDQAVMHDAAARGKQKLAARDYESALGYFQDAASSCPNNAKAELDVARVYEAMGERDHAAAHYRRAAALGKGAEALTGAQARQALQRLAEKEP